MANNDLDIFNLGVEDINLHKREKKKSVLYNPSAKEGKDGVYKALIRFIPNVANPQKSIVRKYVYWLTDEEGKGSYYDCPSTIGEKSPIQQMFFKLYKSESAKDRELAEKLKRREQFYSLIQVIKDPHNPDLDGEFMIFKYGQKIKAKIDAAMDPEFEETPINVFDLFNGKNFELIITKQGDYNNYDNAKFSTNISSVRLDGKEVENNEEGRAKILATLKEAPGLASFDYKPWSDEDRSKVESILDQFRNPGEMVDTVVSDKGKGGNSKPSNDFMSSMDLDSSDDDGSETKEKVAETTTASGGDDDLDDFLNNLNI